MSQTEILAIWGAVTGTVGTVAGLLGLWLRFRQHGLDKPRLVCEASFGFDSPNRPNHKITIRSVGRRPVAIDSVKYFIRLKPWYHRITRAWQHKNGRWLWHQKPRESIKLNEGEKREVVISLPDGLDITDIYRVEVVDQTARRWPVKWVSKSRLCKTATQETLDEFADENDKRIVSATGYRVGERYYLDTKFNTKPARTGKPCGRGFWFFDVHKYREKLQDVKSTQASCFLSGEAEEIK
jgi:predicted DNA-binding antitoxin AbrB/MazE fold protein